MEGQRAEILEEMEGTLFKRKMPSRKVPEIFGLMGFWRLWRLGSFCECAASCDLFSGPLDQHPNADRFWLSKLFGVVLKKFDLRLIGSGHRQA